MSLVEKSFSKISLFNVLRRLWFLCSREEKVDKLFAQWTTEFLSESWRKDFSKLSLVVKNMYLHNQEFNPQFDKEVFFKDLKHFKILSKIVILFF